MAVVSNPLGGLFKAPDLGDTGFSEIKMEAVSRLHPRDDHPQQPTAAHTVPASGPQRPSEGGGTAPPSPYRRQLPASPARSPGSGRTPPTDSMPLLSTEPRTSRRECRLSCCCTGTLTPTFQKVTSHQTPDPTVCHAGSPRASKRQSYILHSLRPKSLCLEGTAQSTTLGAF